MLVGLGTGSTAAHAVRALGRRVADGLTIHAVATSEATAALARRCGIVVLDFADIAAIDLAIDGVDEIDAACRAIKGAGGAMLREKVVAASAQRMIAVADGSKRVARLGAASVPVEVLPFATTFVAAAITRAGGVPALRRGGAGRYVTDNGNGVIDAAFGAIADPAALAVRLQAIPGVLAHGLFLDEIDAAYIAGDGIVTKLERAP